MRAFWRKRPLALCAPCGSPEKFLALLDYLKGRKRKFANQIDIDTNRQIMGELLHDKESGIDSASALQKAVYNHVVWEWSREQREDGGQAIFFGPNTTDLSEGGRYEILFYIRGTGFNLPREIKQNHVLFEIDETCPTPHARTDNL